ncbi:MAG: hypothetical protein AAB354_04465 [candidate division KSB1 bacterium]
MSHFFPMPRRDRWYLLAILLFATMAFLPWAKHMHFAGVALFGWLMAALMVFSPALALLLFWREHKGRRM